uniref:BTB domain-containing protein n=1 Tax=Strigamia maritima TaxID=126957 RepID=T1J0F4_STRMM
MDQNQQQHSATATLNMTLMHNESLFTDVTIICGSLVFPAHRIILAAHSPYLKAMFTHDMKEGEYTELEIKAPLDPTATKKILQYMYTGQIDLDENVELILESADYMQVNHVMDLCSKNLLDSVSPQKFLQVWHTFKKFNRFQDSSSLVRYLSERFYKLQTSEEYFELPLEFLNELIQCFLFPLSDDETVEALLNWAKYNPDLRISQLNVLLSDFRRIHYSNLSPAFVIKFFEDPHCWQVPQLRQIIQSAVIEKWWKRSECTSLINIREEIISCEVFNHEDEEWIEKIDVIKPKEITCDDVIHVFAHVNNIYFFTAAKVHCLNVETKTWTNFRAISSDISEPHHVRAVICDGYLYLLDPHSYRRLKLDSNNENWQEISSFITEYDQPNSFLAVVFDGTIYIINKTLKNSKTLCMYSYDAKNNLWFPHFVEVNGTSSFVHLCVATSECIYLMNGSNKTIYILSRRNDKWVVSLTRLDAVYDFGFFKSLFYNLKDNSFHLCAANGEMSVCKKSSSDLPSIIDTANGFYKIGVYSRVNSYSSEMLEKDIYYVRCEASSICENIMSDLGDRGRRRKKRGIKIKESESPVSMPRPIILVKPPTERSASVSSDTSSRTASKTVSDPVPTVLLRSREESGTPPHMTQSSSAITATSSATTTTTILQKSTVAISSAGNTPTSEVGPSLENRLAPLPEMKSPVKLIDDNLLWCDNAVEFLQDQTDYFVIGVIGFQGVGKSTLLSYLAGNKPEESPKSYIFKAQTRELRELGEHGTNGIDIFITPERVIILDVQPVLSASVMDHMMQYEKKYSTEYPSVESALEIQSLQITSFLMAVCHTILLVQDWFCDATLLRFIHTAEMLKPSTPAAAHDPALGLEDQIEYYPHLVFVHTRCSREQFTDSWAKSVQDMYASVFATSKLKFRGPIGQKCVNTSPSTALKKSGVNVFLIPDKYAIDVANQDLNGTIPTYQGHPGYGALVNNFCNQVTLLPRSPIARTNQSEKNW